MKDPTQQRAENAARMRVYRAKFPEIVAAQARAYRQRHKSVAQERDWKYRGLPMPTRPNPGTCECCGGINPKRALNNDHCHRDNKFRGWLCNVCNTLLGIMGDNADGVRTYTDKLLAYLERS